MTVDPVPGRDSIYTVEAPMMGMPQTCAVYVIDGPEPAIIDTGPADAVDHIFDGLDALGIDESEVSYLVPTHAHLDHAGGAGHLAAECENATVICHPNAIDFLTDEEKLAHLTDAVERAIGMESPYGEPRVIDRDRCQILGDGDVLEIGSRELDVIDAPGHAPHQFCLYDRESAALFAADAAGMRFPDTGHRPTTPPSDFDLEQKLATLDRLREFEPERLLYPHFGPGEAGGGMDELATYAEMLPEYVDQVAQARETHGDDVGAIASEMPEWQHWSLEADIAGILRYLDQREAVSD